jgi:arylsulfatase A-like enzyme
MFLLLWLPGVAPQLGCAMGTDTRILVVVLDGCRPDYLSSELMPRCFWEAKGGVIGTAHHAALPSVTRVNAATMTTGCYPSRHGLMANTIYVPEVNPTGSISTGSRKNLLDAAKAWGGRLLTAPTLAELLDQHGQKLLVCSSGSSGSATLLNPTGAGAGILHPEFCVPENATARMYEILGPKPPDTEPARAKMTWMTDAYLKIGVPDHDPRVTFLWFTDPDHTAHEKGIGARETSEGIRIADEQLGRIFDFHRARGMKVNVFLVADHGFATYGGKFEVAATLKAKGWMERAKPVVIGGAIYVPKEQEEHLAAMVRDLQAEPSIGPIFTMAKSKGSEKGKFPGTLSLDLIGGNHPRAAQIVAYPNWTSERNASGYPGMVQAPGTAGHGGISLWEISAVFAAFGPDIKAGVRSDVPTSNADLAPTIAYLLNIPVPKEMDGRVLREVLKEGPAPQKVNVRRKEWAATLPEKSYSVTVKTSQVDGHRYVDEASAVHE